MVLEGRLSLREASDRHVKQFKGVVARDGPGGLAPFAVRPRWKMTTRSDSGELRPILLRAVTGLPMPGLGLR